MHASSRAKESSRRFASGPLGWHHVLGGKKANPLRDEARRRRVSGDYAHPLGRLDASDKRVSDMLELGELGQLCQHGSFGSGR